MLSFIGHANIWQSLIIIAFALFCITSIIMSVVNPILIDRHKEQIRLANSKKKKI